MWVRAYACVCVCVGGRVHIDFGLGVLTNVSVATV